MGEPDPQPQKSSVQHLEVGADAAGQRLDNYLHRVLGGVPRSRIYRVIRKGEVRVNGRRAGPETRLAAEDKVRIPPLRIAAEPPGPPRPSADLTERIARAIIHEDDRLLVIDKPAGLAVHGGSGVSFGLIEALRALRPEESLELVHRLDRDTSGLLLVARRGSALRSLHALLREEGLEKRYLALVKGQWNLGAKRVDVPLRTDTRVGGERTVRASASGKASVSTFRPVQFFGKTATLMEVTLETGRTHQIRVHAQHAGHPVAGDAKYGDAPFNEAMQALGLKRMFLHAHSLSFAWPDGGEFSINTPLPAELAAVLDRLAAKPRPKARGSRRSAARPRARRAAGR
ncbi:MAG TPA: RluA family pseudouridine synthase [Steroidobacteraceae bacterium]|jgi:23S rRNA pseudouridine955/2504/2580 synthase|nr:RluA family pseudouridine synthase [Steroidobacteraceae bacterium]